MKQQNHYSIFYKIFLKKKLFILTIFCVPLLCMGQTLRYPAVWKDNKFSSSDFGFYFPMYLANRMPFIDVYLNGVNGQPIPTIRGTFLVDYGTDTTVIDLDGFSGTSITRANNHQYTFMFKDGPWENATYNGPHTAPFAYEQSLGGFQANGIRESGIVGTDILSQLILTLDYKYSRFYIATDRISQCTPERIKALGFVAASTKGYFSSDKSTLVWPKINPGGQLNNNPHVPITIFDGTDSIQALASIDPGFDDRLYLNQDFNTYYTHSININQQFYDHLLEKHINVTIDRNKFVTLSNRTAIPDTLFVCRFGKKYDFSMLSTEGKKINSYSTDNINVFLKVNGQGGASAGGITTLPFPVAQFGGSFLLDFDVVIFDPFRSLVWFRKP